MHNCEPSEDKYVNTHTCGTDPGRHGDVALACDSCYNDAYMRGKNFGAREATNLFAMQMADSIREDLDPLIEEDETKAIVKWNIARALLVHVKNTHDDITRNHDGEYSQHMDQNLLRVMTKEEFAIYDQERKDAQKIR